MNLRRLVLVRVVHLRPLPVRALHVIVGRLGRQMQQRVQLPLRAPVTLLLRRLHPWLVPSTLQPSLAPTAETHARNSLLVSNPRRTQTTGHGPAWRQKGVAESGARMRERRHGDRGHDRETGGNRSLPRRAQSIASGEADSASPPERSFPL